MATRYVDPASGAAGIRTAIDASSAGDVIQLQANATYTGQLILPNKSLSGYILITTNANSIYLPGPNVRIDPSYSVYMPRLQSTQNNVPSVTCLEGANYFKFQYVYFVNTPRGEGEIMRIGDGTQAFEWQMPNYIWVDQCIFMGGADCGQRRAIYANGRNMIIRNSYFDHINVPSTGQDAQIICCANGAGPLEITNNYMEGGTEPFMAGGMNPYCRTYMMVAGSSTEGRSFVSCTEPGHTLGDLRIGQRINAHTANGNECSYINGIESNGISGYISFSPPFSSPPNGELRTGVILSDVTFSRNHVLHYPYELSGWLDTPTLTGVAQTTSGGTLGTGSYYYRVQAATTNGYQGTSAWGPISNEVHLTLSSTGRNYLSWTAVAGASVYRLYRTPVNGNPGGETLYLDVAGLSWYDSTPTMISGNASPVAATQVRIKNLFEIKSAQNVLVEGNIFEYCDKGVDSGSVIWLKSCNQEPGNGWWTGSQDITVQNNLFRHCFGALLFSGEETYMSSPRPPILKNVTVRNNLFYDCGYMYGDGGNRPAFWLPNGGVQNVTLDHNTIICLTQSGGFDAWSEFDSTRMTSPVVDLSIINNMLRGNYYGVRDSNGYGLTAFANISANGSYEFQKNVISIPGLSQTLSDGTHPNWVPTVVDWENSFVNYTADGVNADYHIDNATYIDAGTDGKDIGADIDELYAALEYTEEPQTTPEIRVDDEVHFLNDLTPEIPQTGTVPRSASEIYLRLTDQVPITSNLPPPWLSQDIADLSQNLPGGASGNGSSFTLIGDGYDVWYSNDAFRYVYQPLIGDCEIVCRIPSAPVVTDPPYSGSVSDYAKTGLMMRSNETVGSPMIHIALNPATALWNNQIRVEFVQRLSQNIDAVLIAEAFLAYSYPVWLKLARVSDTITGYYSANGTDWTVIGVSDIAYGSVLFDWIADPDLNVVQYQIEVGTVSGGSDYGTFLTGSVEPNYWLTLPVGPTYYVRARSVYSNGNTGGVSNEVTFTL